MNHLRLGSALALVALLSLSCRSVTGVGPSISGATEPSHDPVISSSPSPEPSVYPEIAWYAEEFGISLEEAIRRTNIMLDFDSIPLREAVGNRWAGGWMEHEPEFRYVVRITGEGWEEFLALAAEMPLPIHFVDGAAHRESEVLAAMEVVQARIIADGLEMSMGSDTKTGSIVLYGPEELSDDYLAELQALTGVPVRYENSPLPVTQPLIEELPSITP